jgi:SHS2 domain-containing protein
MDPASSKEFRPMRGALPPEAAYFDHDADVGVIGRGARPEDAFVGAARATFALVTRLEDVRPLEAIEVDFEEPDAELALVTWLNRLIAQSQARGLVLGEFALARDGDRWRGTARGEPWREGLERGVDVKGATLTMLSVKPAGDGWEARCVVDV